MMRREASPLLSRIGVFIWAWPDGPPMMQARLAQLTQWGFALTQQWSRQSAMRRRSRRRERYARQPLPLSLMVW